MSLGGYHTCGLRSDATVECWGGDDSGQSTVPAGTILAVSAGGLHTCAIRSDRSLECWGSSSEDKLAAPQGAFEGVSAGWNFTCALRSVDAVVVCWGNNSYGVKTTPALGPWTWS